MITATLRVLSIVLRGRIRLRAFIMALKRGGIQPRAYS
jgi:hypothetical protein